MVIVFINFETKKEGSCKPTNQSALSQWLFTSLTYLIEAFIPILLNVNLSLNQTLLTFLLYVRQTWMTQLILAISLWGLSSFNTKRFYYSHAWSCSLCKRRTSFCTGLISRKQLQILTYVFHYLYFSQCLISFSSIDHLLHCYGQFLRFSRSTHLPYVFVFGDFNVHYKDWLAYSYSDG